MSVLPVGVRRLRAGVGLGGALLLLIGSCGQPGARSAQRATSQAHEAARDAEARRAADAEASRNADAEASRAADMDAASPTPSADGALDPAMEALLAEEASFADRARTFGVAAQKTPTGYRPPPALGAFPYSRIATAAAITFGHVAPRGERCAVEREPLRRDGTFCGDVAAPVAQLTAAERDEILDLLREAERAHAAQRATGTYALRGRLRCGFDPHHALIFFDDKGRPVARVLVCLTCGEWIVTPGSEATGGSEHAIIAGPEQKTLRRILDAHKLGAWMYEAQRWDAIREYDERIYGTESALTPRGVARRDQRLATGSGIASGKSMRDLDAAERTSLCRWTLEEVRPAPGRRNPGEGDGYECPSGETWAARYGEQDCGKRTIDCARTVGEVEACLRVFREPKHLCADRPAACDGVLDCLPGFVRGTPRR